MLKLQQDQVWKIDGGYLRIVRLERLSVAYKSLQDLATRDGTHHEVSKKEFSRLIKSATLLTPDEARNARGHSHPSGSLALHHFQKIGRRGQVHSWLQPGTTKGFQRAGMADPSGFGPG